MASKATGDGDKIKRHLLLERKAMTNLETILKRRDITSLCQQGSVESKGWFFYSHVWM